MIRDRIVCGIADNPTRRKLLQEPKLSLKKCLDLYRASEATSGQLKGISGEVVTPPSEKANAVKRERKPKKSQTRPKFPHKESVRNYMFDKENREMSSIWEYLSCMWKAEPFF